MLDATKIVLMRFYYFKSSWVRQLFQVDLDFEKYISHQFIKAFHSFNTILEIRNQDIKR